MNNASPQGPAHLVLQAALSPSHPRLIHSSAHQSLPFLGIALPPCLCAPIHWHFRLSSSNNAPATSHLRPSSRPPTRINDYYHLIYVLYAYRSLSRPYRCLISAIGQLSAALRRPYPRSNRARATEYVWRNVADGHGSEQSTSNPYSQSLDFSSSLSPDLLKRFGSSCLPILVSSVAWLVRAR